MGIFNWLNKKEDREVTTQRNSDFSSFTLVTDFIYEQSGIIDLDKRALAASRIQQYAQSKNIYTTNELLDNLKNMGECYQDVMNIATVNETFFMREVKELEWLVQHVKSKGLSNHKRFKILSMPCSSGEEVYSILLMLEAEGVDISLIEITGYDLNSQAIVNAVKGEYDERSLHKIDMNMRDKYFTEIDNNFQISSVIREIPSFTQKNIFDLVYEKTTYDIVLSRNMFIYFDDEKRASALNIIVNLLNEGGIYIKGHADHIKQHMYLKKIKYGIYQKIDLIEKTGA